MVEETTQVEQTTTEPSQQTAEPVVSEHGEDKGTEVTYANGKYKSVSDLEKGYAELQKSYSSKLGGFTGSPEAYEYAEGLSGNEFIEQWGKENQLSNDGMNSLVKGFNEYQQAQQEAANKAYMDEQMKALGENAQERIKNVKDFLKANTGVDSLSNVDAKGIEVFEKLIAMSKQSSLADTKPTPSYDKEKLDFMQFQEKDANGNRRYETDQKFRAKVLELRSQLS